MKSFISSWSYTILLGLASAVSFGKIFLYSHILPIEDFAYINYFFIAVGVTFLLLGVGIVTRSHIDFARGFKKYESGSNYLVPKFQSAIIVNGFISAVLLVIVSTIDHSNSYFIIYAAILHSMLNLVFFLELIYQKSTGDFTGYGSRLLIRNVLVLLSGYIAYEIFRSGDAIIYGELFLLLALNIKLLYYLFKRFSLPTKAFIKESLKYVPVTVMAVLLQYVDRLSATATLPAEQFSAFSYYSLLILMGLTLQQIVNTRFLRSITIDVMDNKQKAFQNTLIAMGGLFLVQMAVLSTMGYVLSYWLAPEWFVADFSVLSIFVLIGAIRGSDLITGYCIAGEEKKVLFLFQLSVATLIATYIFTYGASHFSLKSLMAGMLAVFIAGYIFMALVLYIKLRLVTKTVN